MQIEDLPDVTLQRVPTPIFRKDAHLSSALITTEIEYMFEHRNNPRAIKREHRELLDRIQDSHVRECNQFIPWIMENWKDLSHTGESIAMLMTALRVATHALRISVLDYIGIDHTINLTPTEELLTVYKAKRNFDKIIKHITYSKEFHQNYLLGKYKGDVYGNLHVIWEKEKVCWVVTHSHFVCIRDMINSWFDALLYGLVASQKYPPYNFYYEIEKVLKHGRLLVSHHGQKAYSLFKLWPSLIIASILRDTENKRNFFAALLKDVEIFVNTPFYQYTTAPITSDAQVHMLLELSGMWKCFGHPNINMSASVNAWKEKGSVGKNISPHMANLIDWAFKLEFCRQYYKQHKRWPAVKMGSHAPMKIKRNYQNNTWDETPSRKWAPEDFEHVTLQKNLDFDYHVDMSDLLADKSIIPSRSQWIYEYDRQAHRTLYGKFPYGPPQTSKSAIVHYLQLDSIDVKEVIDILQSGLIPDEWKIMVAVAKERELKDKSRFYGKMCFEMRLYQTATEKNIADPLFKYVKNQSMTMSEEQLLRTILRMNTPVLQIEGETYVFIVLDFSSWCTSFRLELITPLFITIDQLFGLHNVYSFTHYFPLISHLIFQDRFYPPEQGDDGLPKMGPRCYPYPEAWLEGLRQKGWTLATLLIILIASWTCGTSASLLGQGDNQVILLRIPPSSYLEAQQLSRDDYIEGFLRVLDDLCDKAGIIIKIEETWYSRNLFEYSRKYHYKGAQVSCCLKRISRLASEANLVAPSLSGILAGMYSTGSAAAAEDNTPMASYYCTVVEACLKLWEENEWMVKEPWEYTCCLLLITRCLGGYPITTYSQFCTRSVQDVLSTNLHLVRTASRDNILGPYISRVVNLDVSIHKDFLSLVKDPQSLPLMQPVQPENFIKREIKKGLEHHIKNKDVKDLFSFSASESQDKLVRDLSNIKPCNPKLLNKLWSLSNIGLQERWTGMFANTRSIQQMAFKNWSDELDVIMSIRNMELQYSRHLQHKKSSHHIDDIKNCECITTYTQLTRERMWGLAMEGITMPPQQEQTRMVEWDTLTVNQAQRAILFIEQDDIPLIKTLSRGKFSPYFGSTTRLRARRSLLQVVEVGSVISSLKQLMELHGWVRGNPQMTSLIETLIKEKTTLSIEELQKYSQKVYSGSLTHRLPCPAMRRGGMANQNLNHSSFYTITSDTAIDYSKGGINYTICFQSVFLYGLSTLAHYTDIGVPFRKQMGLVFTCSKCTWVIPPESFSLNSNDYHGIQLPNMVKELHHKDVFERYPLHIQMDENISYSVQMARKTAAWIVGRRMIDKITSLDNRAMEENLTLSFVNLAEFSRLRVSMYLKSFIFYCAVYDPLFFTQQYDYFNEVLEGISKNPYDVILDNLRRCGHTRELCTMQGGPPKHSYTISEMRTLLYNILTSLCEDYKGILTSAYILTQEDGLPVVIRAIQVWLQVNEIPCYITSDMTSSELDSAIEKYYKGYHAIRPVTTLSEEETTYLIRASPIRTLTQEDRRYITLPIRRNIQSSHQETNYEGVEYLWIIEENAVLSSLAEVMQSPTFLEKCEGHHLVTLGDKDGTGYTLLYHTWIFLPGYPHYHETVDWEKDPHSITCDSCNIEWNRRDYYCNGPKSIVDIPSNCLVVIFPHCPTLFGMRPDTLVLQYYTTSTHPPGDVYWCLAHTNREGRWVLHKAEGLITGDKQYISDVTLTNSMTALSHLRSYLSVHLRESMCFSPFAEVSHMLGCVPQTPTALILVLKSRIRGVLMSWIVTRGRPTSYEGIIEAEKQKRRRILKLRRIATYHVVYNMLLQKPWHATGIIGRYPYHTHVRGYTRRVCWSRCREGVSVLDVSSLSIIEYHMRTWLRYLWIICSEESARHGTMKAPSLKFLPF